MHVTALQQVAPWAPDRQSCAFVANDSLTDRQMHAEVVSGMAFVECKVSMAASAAAESIYTGLQPMGRAEKRTPKKGCCFMAQILSV